MALQRHVLTTAERILHRFDLGELIFDTDTLCWFIGDAKITPGGIGPVTCDPSVLQPIPLEFNHILVGDNTLPINQAAPLPPGALGSSLIIDPTTGNVSWGPGPLEVVDQNLIQNRLVTNTNSPGATFDINLVPSAGTGTMQMTFTPDAGNIELRTDDGLGNASQLLVEPSGIVMNFGAGATDLIVQGTPGFDGQYLRSYGNDNAPQWTTPTILEASDTPAVYGVAGQVLGMNLAGTALEWTSPFDIYVDGASFNAVTSILTLTDADPGTPDVTIDLSALEQLTSIAQVGGNIAYTDEDLVVTNIPVSGFVSADANNELVVGTDGLIYHDETLTTFAQVANNLAYTDEDAVVTNVPVAGFISADALNGLVAGTDGLLYFAQAAVNTIYSADDSLVGNRVVDLAGNLLRFTSLGPGLEALNIIPAGNVASLFGGTPAGGGGIRLDPQGVHLDFIGAGDLQLGIDPGTTGQVIRSNGPGVAPTWEDISTLETDTSLALVGGIIRYVAEDGLNDDVAVSTLVSADANNSIIAGTDGLLYLDESDTTYTLAAGGILRYVAEDGFPDDVAVSTLISADLNNNIVAGADGLLYLAVPAAAVSADAGNELTLGTDGLPYHDETVTSLTLGVGGLISYSNENLATTTFLVSDYISTDANNSIGSGTDGLLFLDESDTSFQLVAGGILRYVAEDALADDVTVASLISTDATNAVVAGTDGLLFVAPGAAPVIVSADALNDVVAGTDGGAFFTETDTSLTLVNNAAGDIIRYTAEDGLADDIPLTALLSADAGNTLAIGTDGGLNVTAPVVVDLNTTVAGTATLNPGAAPVAPPGAPDTGDVHIETHTESIGYWVWNGAAWVLSAQFDAPAQIIVSADALNDITVGTDGGAFFTETNETFTLVDSGGATPDILRFVGASGLNQDIGLDATVSVQAGNALAIGTDGRLYVTPGAAPTIVSTDAGNTVVAGTDGGAYQAVFGGATGVVAGTGGSVPAPAAGEDDEFLRGDGTWAAIPPTGISADAGNDLTLGTDTLPYFAETDTSLALIAGGTIRYVAEDGLNDDITVAGLASADAGNDLVAGTDGLLFVDVPAVAVSADAGNDLTLGTDAQPYFAETDETYTLVDGGGAATDILRFVGATGVNQDVPLANLVSVQAANALAIGTDGRFYVAPGGAPTIVSTDAGNDIIAGTDGGAYLAETVTSLALAAGGNLSFIDEAGVTNNTPVSGFISADAGNDIVAGADGLLFLDVAAPANETFTLIDGGGAATDILRFVGQSGLNQDITLADLVSVQAANALAVGTDGRLYVAPGGAPTIVSTDVGNDITAGTDGGAYLAETVTSLTHGGAAGLTYSDEAGTANTVLLISTTAGNDVTYNADGLFVDVSALETDTTLTLVNNAAGDIIRYVGEDGVNQDVTLPSLLSADAGNIVTVGADGGLYAAAGGAAVNETFSLIDGGGAATDILRFVGQNAANQDVTLASLVSVQGANALSIGTDGRFYVAAGGAPTIVSTDVGNDIIAGTDGGAYLAETVTALTHGGAAGLTYSDEAGTANTVLLISTTAGNDVTYNADGLFLDVSALETDTSYALIAGGTLRYVAEDGLNDDVAVVSLASADAGNEIGAGADGLLYVKPIVNETYSLVDGGGAATDILRFVGQSGANQDVTLASMVSAAGGNVLSIGADGRFYVAAGGAPTIVSADAGNDITVGTDGGAYLAETVTALSYNAVGGTLTYADEAGVSNTVVVIATDAGNALTTGTDGLFVPTVAAPVNETYTLVDGGGAASDILRFVGQSGANQDVLVSALISTDADSDLVLGTDGLLARKPTPPPAYDNDAAAGVGGLVAGELYQTTATNTLGHPVGTLMVKQ